MERDIEKDLIEIECAIKSQKEKDNVFTMSVLQRCHKLVSELKGYKDLEEQGRLPKPPCAVGDIVYALWSVPTEQRYAIYPAEVNEICIGRYMNRKTIKYRLEPISYRGRILDFYSDDFENKFFLTREEAEAALEGLLEVEDA